MNHDEDTQRLLEGLAIIMSCMAGVIFVDANKQERFEKAKEDFREEAIGKIRPYADAFRAQGRREAAEAWCSICDYISLGCTEHCVNRNAILGTASAEKTDKPATFPRHDNDGQTA
jgi:hypothetical protein